jgi:N-acetylglutamate synthase-like GNAT family acetyltransferase
MSALRLPHLVPFRVAIRSAVPADQEAIRALVKSERLNPMGIDWPNFLVAVGTRGIVGAVQLRKHPDGSRELGSLVVAPEARGHGIAARLIDALVTGHDGPVQMITGAQHAAHYQRWGFRRLEASRAPRSIRLNYRLGSLACVISVLKRRAPRRLVILHRA